jgi:hypothetical protein
MPRALDQRTYQCRSQPITASVNSHGRGTPKDYQNLPAQTPFSKLRTNGYMKGYRVEFGITKSKFARTKPEKQHSLDHYRQKSQKKSKKERTEWRTSDPVADRASLATLPALTLNQDQTTKTVGQPRKKQSESF